MIDEESYRTTRDALLVEKTEIKKEKERLQRSRTGFWIEPAREVVNTLEILGKSDFSESLPEISRLVQKIGTNRLISRKTVTFSFSPPYDFISDLLGVFYTPHSSSSPAPSAAVSESTVWCAREDLNLQSFRNQILSLARLPFRHARIPVFQPVVVTFEPALDGCDSICDTVQW